jgi:hypothetical protein
VTTKIKVSPKALRKAAGAAEEDAQASDALLHGNPTLDLDAA